MQSPTRSWTAAPPLGTPVAVKIFLDCWKWMSRWQVRINGLYRWFVNGGMGVSLNGGTPQIFHFNWGFHYFHHPFWGIRPIFGNTRFCRGKKPTDPNLLPALPGTSLCGVASAASRWNGGFLFLSFFSLVNQQDGRRWNEYLTLISINMALHGGTEMNTTWNIWNGAIFFFFFFGFTLPETISQACFCSPLKNRLFKKADPTYQGFQGRCHVSFREGGYQRVPEWRGMAFVSVCEATWENSSLRVEELGLNQIRV